ncbi:MAG: ComEC/Rec2 family competence protein [Planctomycetota bacterium]|jgi:beta-lactamase superfamily II metal-dependent hydrolase
MAQFRWMKGGVWLSIAVGVIATLALVTPTVQAGTLDVYWVDVEGGAATLIVTPAGESVLIDTGNPGQRDAGRIHRVATEVAGLKQIDFLITTHYDRDHFGGAADLAKLMPIRHVYDNGPMSEGPRQPTPEYLAFKSRSRNLIQPGDTIPVKQAEGAAPLSLTCIGTRTEFVRPTPAQRQNATTCTHEPGPPDPSENKNSTIFVIKLGDFEFFDGGDITWNVEHDLVCPVNRVGEVDVFQVDHHGLDRSNHPALVHALAPHVTVFNNGDKKGCGPQTFQTVKNTPSTKAIYQLHMNLREDRENNTAPDYIANKKPGKECDGHYVKLSVDPDGAAYRFSVPSTGHEQAYRTR